MSKHEHDSIYINHYAMRQLQERQRLSKLAEAREAERLAARKMRDMVGELPSEVFENDVSDAPVKAYDAARAEVDRLENEQ